MTEVHNIYVRATGSQVPVLPNPDPAGLPVLKKAILAARPRPEIAGYNQLSLAISSAVHRALAQQVPVTQTLTSLNTLLIQIVRKS
jgi:hypothetical protein